MNEEITNDLNASSDGIPIARSAKTRAQTQINTQREDETNVKGVNKEVPKRRSSNGGEEEA